MFVQQFTVLQTKVLQKLVSCSVNVCSPKACTWKMKYGTEFLLDVLIKLILIFIYASYLLQILSENAMCISVQPRSPQEWRILVTEPHHPCTSKWITWFSGYQIYSSPSHVKLPHFWFLPLSLFVIILPFSLSPVLGIMHTVFLVPSCTAAFLFLSKLSLQERKKHGHYLAAGWKMNSMTEQRAMGSRELGAAPAQCSCRHSETGKRLPDCQQKPSHHLVSLYWSCVR